MDRSRLVILHTADLHIGDDATAAHAARRLAGLTAVVDTAIQRRVDAVLIAGDFFDNSRIAYQDVNAALEQLARLSVPVVVTPGNHDCLGAPSIYERVRLADAGPHVRFLDDPDGSHAVYKGLGLSVWARGLVVHDPRNLPLAGYQPLHDDHWQIAMAHGFYLPSDSRISMFSSPLRQEQIDAMACDYLALGHWHRFVQVGGTQAYYSGSPSEANTSFASANLVTLDPVDGVQVTRVPTQPGLD